MAGARKSAKFVSTKPKKTTTKKSGTMIQQLLKGKDPKIAGSRRKK